MHALISLTHIHFFFIILFYRNGGMAKIKLHSHRTLQRKNAFEVMVFIHTYTYRIRTQLTSNCKFSRYIRWLFLPHTHTHAKMLCSLCLNVDLRSFQSTFVFILIHADALAQFTICTYIFMKERKKLQKFFICSIWNNFPWSRSVFFIVSSTHTYT